MTDLQPRQGAELGLLLDDIKTLIDQARQQVAVAVNVGLTFLYWQVGQRIRTDLLQEKDRAAYGEEIVATLSRQLTQHYGKGFTKSSLNRMVQFAEAFPDPKIVATLSQQLSWSHFVLLLPLDKPMQRDYYAEMCRIERWSVRTLSAKINGMLYERTALSRQPDALIQKELDTLRDTACRAGMRTLAEDGRRLVESGETTFDEVLSVTPADEFNQRRATSPQPGSS
jgi:hypothetical protein